MKLLAVLGMILYHSGFNSIPDYGAFACIFFFIMSGFTTAFFKMDEWEISQKSILSYYKKKMDGICWIYYFSFVLMIPLTIRDIDSLKSVKEAICDGIMHLLFIQCWFPNITFKYNAVAWFSSALLFCYLLTPILIALVRILKNSVKQVLLLTIILHIFLEFCSINYPDIFGYSMHTNPFIKCIEYFLGMLLAVIFKTYYLDNKNRVLFSAFELFSVCLVGGSIYLYTMCGYKSIVIIPIIIMVYCFAYGKGFLSSALSMDYFGISRLQSEIYLLHYPVIMYSGFVIRRVSGINGLNAIMYMILTILVAYFVHSGWQKIKKKS